MGLFKKSCYTNNSNQTVYVSDTNTVNWSAPNPNPGNFTILRVKEFGKLHAAPATVLVAEIYYKGCTNYEGKKICVFQNLTEKALRSLRYLDPHFADTSFAPVARFKPDANGWDNACKFAKSLA